MAEEHHTYSEKTTYLLVFALILTHPKKETKYYRAHYESRIIHPLLC